MAFIKAVWRQLPCQEAQMQAPCCTSLSACLAAGLHTQDSLRKGASTAREVPCLQVVDAALLQAARLHGRLVHQQLGVRRQLHQAPLPPACHVVLRRPQLHAVELQAGRRLTKRVRLPCFLLDHFGDDNTCLLAARSRAARDAHTR